MLSLMDCSVAGWLAGFMFTSSAEMIFNVAEIQVSEYGCCIRLLRRHPVGRTAAGGSNNGVLLKGAALVQLRAKQPLYFSAGGSGDAAVFKQQGLLKAEVVFLRNPLPHKR